MQTVVKTAELRGVMKKIRAQGRRTALITTMGALHAGHVSLIAIAKARGCFTVLSIFVNPLQFNNTADLERYPRSLDKDAILAAGAGVDLLFAPTVEEIFGQRDRAPADCARIMAGSVARLHEGQSRPGHFDGMTTIVGTLFNLVRPDITIFGEKDLQQLRVVEQMVSDLHFGIEVIPAPTCRDPDGLAMSSRNTRLSDTQRQRALSIPNSLNLAAKMVTQGERNALSIESAVKDSLQQADLRVDYVVVVNRSDLAQVAEITTDSQLLVAAFVDDIRLIDNCRLSQANY